MIRNLLLTGCALGGLIFASAALPSEMAAQVRAADAAGFVGQWVLPLDAQGQQFELPITVNQDPSGNLAVTVGGFEGGEAQVEQISLQDGALVLQYDGSAQGQSFPVELKLTPNGESLNANLDIAEGAFALTGTATKRQS